MRSPKINGADTISGSAPQVRDVGVKTEPFSPKLKSPLHSLERVDQLKRGHGNGEVDAGLCLDAERFQHEGAVEATGQQIGTPPVTTLASALTP